MVFSNQEKNLTSAKKLKRGIKTGATNSQNVVDLFCWGEGVGGLDSLLLGPRELSINN